MEQRKRPQKAPEKLSDGIGQRKAQAALERQAALDAAKKVAYDRECHAVAIETNQTDYFNHWGRLHGNK
jgi:hypothetical protein